MNFGIQLVISQRENDEGHTLLVQTLFAGVSIVESTSCVLLCVVVNLSTLFSLHSQLKLIMVDLRIPLSV
jgi:hypothetical protein